MNAALSTRRICRALWPLERAALQRSTTRHSSSSLAHYTTARGHAIYAARAVALALAIGGATTYLRPAICAEEARLRPKGKERERVYRLEEVKQHGPDAERIWAYRGDGVYDITDWIPLHPGGGVILRSAGNDIQAFWDIFAIHKQQEIYDILEEYRIGTIDPRDLVNGRVPQSAVNDPFAHDPARDAALKQHTDKPCNAETPVEMLSDFITPNRYHYVRNHMWCPVVKDADAYSITVELYDGTERHYTLAELKRTFKPRSITATLQCSGNRRSHMTRASRGTQGLQWGPGAIGTATWTGVKLRDVLAHAGMDVDDPDPEAKHAAFTGREAYGASIPISKAIDPSGDTLLAYEMNGEPLPVDHGFPLRVIVPGNVAARSVKWIDRIVVSSEESSSQWQQRDYKLWTPGHRINWEKATAIQETPVNSAITSIRDSTTFSALERDVLRTYGLEKDTVVVSGWAMSGGGRAIVRVDVSADGGKTWRDAELDHGDVRLPRGAKDWAWKRWTAVYSKVDVGKEFVVKATDEAYNCQPSEHDSIHNDRGNLATAWHRVAFSPADL